MILNTYEIVIIAIGVFLGLLLLVLLYLKMNELVIQKNEFKSLNTNDKIIFLRNKKVSYIIDGKPWEGLKPMKTVGNVYLYKINYNERY